MSSCPEEKVVSASTSACWIPIFVFLDRASFEAEQAPPDSKATWAIANGSGGFFRTGFFAEFAVPAAIVKYSTVSRKSVEGQLACRDAYRRFATEFRECH